MAIHLYSSTHTQDFEWISVNEMYMRVIAEMPKITNPVDVKTELSFSNSLIFAFAPLIYFCKPVTIINIREARELIIKSAKLQSVNV